MMRARLVIVKFLPVGFAIVLAACAPLPQRAGIPTRWSPSSNFDERRPNLVIIHHTAEGSVRHALATLTSSREKVSTHYLIGRDGTIYQLVDERARAWHAGESQWGADTDLNSSSLGIELDNNGDEPFPDAQISALLALLRDIELRYQIPLENFLGHADIAPQRKADPSRYFPWKTLAEHGFGLWCDPPLPDPPAPFDTTLALQALGYDVADPDAAVRAFKLHFAQDDTAPELSDRDRQMLYCLLLKLNKFRQKP
jgi:N-acetylmuramoyl-L-alanine amidase